LPTQWAKLVINKFLLVINMRGVPASESRA